MFRNGGLTRQWREVYAYVREEHAFSGLLRANSRSTAHRRTILPGLPCACISSAVSQESIEYAEDRYNLILQETIETQTQQYLSQNRRTTFCSCAFP